MIGQDQIINKLSSLNLIQADSAVLVPLTGGVSSDIWLVDDGSNKYVVKKALAQLKVEDYWVADVSRNIAEQDFIRFVSTFAAEKVPKILVSEQADPYFVMEYLGPPFETWKRELIKGRFNPGVAETAARFLAEIHNRSWGDKRLARIFDHMDSFEQLRIQPYLVSTGKKHHDLQIFFDQEATRLRGHKVVLVHGDFSPKNMLVNGERLVLLDHEVACMGDPSFDVAFFINHLLLKRVLFPKMGLTKNDLATVAWNTYFRALQIPRKEEVMRSSSKLWLMLLLARVDGKSPVEYLDAKQKTFIRNFVHQYLPSKQAEDFHFLQHEFSAALLNQLNSGPIYD